MGNLYTIETDGEEVGQLYGKNEWEAKEKARHIWKLTGNVEAAVMK